MKKLLPLALGVLIAAPAMASPADGGYLRITTGYTVESIAIEDRDDEITSTGSSIPFQLVYQSQQGFYGGVGYTQSTIDEIEVNNQTFDVDEDFDVISYGLGYRTPFANLGDGQFVGGAYTRHDNDDADTTVDELSIFMEKDTPDRYGKIALNYEHDEFADIFEVAGQHVWFVAPNFGIGVNWSIGGGNVEGIDGSDADAGTASLGFTVMLRGGM